MFQKAELKRILPLFLFFLFYSLLFVLWVKTFFYTLPFLLGFLVAAAVQPILSFLEEKWNWNPTFSAAAVTVCVMAALIGLLAFLGVFAVREITSFIRWVSNGGFAEFSQPVAEFLERAGRYFQNFDLDFWKQNERELLDLLQNSFSLIASFFSTALSALTSLPTVITTFFIMAVSTFFISRDMEKLLAVGRRIFSRSALLHVKAAAENTSGTGRRYLLSYLLIYFITFCETCVILAILNIPYPLTAGIVTAVADILPILGPGIVLTPLAAYQFLLGEYAKGFGVLIGWLVITCIRQIIEPKLVASTMKVPALAMLAAIHFSLIGKSVWILFYVMGFFILYSVFCKTGALPSLMGENEKSPARKAGE